MFTNYLKRAFLAFLVCHGYNFSQQTIIHITTDDGISVDIPASEFIAQLHQKKSSGQTLSATEALYVKTALYHMQETAIREKANDELIKRVGLIETAMDEQGYITFVHGRSWEWNFVNDVWNLICAVQSGVETMSDKISLRYRAPNCDIQKLYRYRQKLLEVGPKSYIGSAADCTGRDAEVTFMNRTLVSHNNYTADYFLRNSSVGNGALEVALKLLKQYGLQHYNDHISKLYGLHKESSQWGEMLCISVHKDHLNDLVYVAEYGGNKKQTDLTCLEQVQACQKKVIDGKDDYLDNQYDSESSIYCFAVTDIPGEEQNMYKISSVTLPKCKKYAQYKKELAGLFDIIRQDGSVGNYLEETAESVVEQCYENVVSSIYVTRFEFGRELTEAMFASIGAVWLGACFTAGIKLVNCVTG